MMKFDTKQEDENDRAALNRDLKDLIVDYIGHDTVRGFKKKFRKLENQDFLEKVCEIFNKHADLRQEKGQHSVFFTMRGLGFESSDNTKKYFDLQGKLKPDYILPLNKLSNYSSSSPSHIPLAIGEALMSSVWLWPSYMLFSRMDSNDVNTVPYMMGGAATLILATKHLRESVEEVKKALKIPKEVREEQIGLGLTEKHNELGKYNPGDSRANIDQLRTPAEMTRILRSTYPVICRPYTI